VKYVNKILIVDDEPDIQDILTAYLRRIPDVEVVNALTGETAVEKYRELIDAGHPPSLVVMDLNLSGSNQDIEAIDRHRRGEDAQMDGVETAQAIRDMDTDAVIWGYTAWEGTSWEHELREIGVTKIVERQVPFKDFAEQVKQFLHE
jgi:CheY-like chemotaxis protein